MCSVQHCVRLLRAVRNSCWGRVQKLPCESPRWASNAKKGRTQVHLGRMEPTRMRHAITTLVKRDVISGSARAWRLVATIGSEEVCVVEGDQVRVFENERDAYAYTLEAYRKFADLRNMQVGQQYSLQMADGSTKTVQVQNQTPQGVNVLDPQSGQVMMIPHLQQGAEPKPVQPGQQGVGVKPQGPTGISPENVTSMRVTAAEIGREPYYCKHDQGYLYRKDPNAPEK